MTQPPHARGPASWAALGVACLALAGCAPSVPAAGPPAPAPSLQSAVTSAGPPTIPVPTRAAPSAPSSPKPVGPDAFQINAPPALAGQKIPTGYVGLSVEAQSVADGSFSAGTAGLVELLRGLHPGFLRVGANTGDSAPLTTAQLTSLAQLSADVPVPIVLQLPLRPDKPKPATAEAVTATQLLGTRLAALEIGNEPDAYGLRGIRKQPWTYRTFLTQRDAYRESLREAGVTTPLWGPDDSGSQWLATTVAEHERPYAAITQHFYPLSNCRPPTPTIRELLSDEILAKEQGEAALMAQASASSRLPVIVDETNSVSCYGGTNGVSNTSASALWALDYGLVMAQAGVAGIGFHVPLSGCAGYSPLCLVGTGSARHWIASPEYDGLATLSGLAGDTFAVESLTSVHHHLRTYALTTPAGAPVLVALDLDPATRGNALLSWQHSASSAAISLTQFGSAIYASTATSPIETGTPAAGIITADSTVTQLLPLAPGTASVFAPPIP